ncbi:S-layer homology domain-containing protein [Paenibacillus spongiae]|uniref:S-layer homology domain-containing protein n=1 Tax=Paenibacillus spongiae TaxID=2909671 RepID=A0ABY5SK86_9BACL|nr:S-layer homology domain-containing protein [Paenibacillus spongiae]UVI32925.1 S-layer homology domain-containing protein [Paenibacillus spongiae]
MTVTASVYDEERARVTASMYNNNGTLVSGPFTLNSAEASPPLQLSAGVNKIKVVVTAEDGASKTYEIAVTRAAVSNPGSSYSGPYVSSNPTDNHTVPLTIHIDGKAFDQIAKAASSRKDDRTTITVNVVSNPLMEKLAQAKDNASVVIPVTSSSDNVILTITGDIVKALENKQAVLEVRTPHGSYRLPAAEIQIDSLSKRLGESVKPSDISVQINIAKSSPEIMKLLENMTDQERFTVIVPPIDFNVTALLGDKKVILDKFNKFVTREIPLPDNMDPSRMTTAVVLEADGILRHVPTSMESRDGKHYAVIRSLTNSTYAIIENSIAFLDMKGHWAKEAVNDLGARKVIDGVDPLHYRPNEAITRAEFAAIIVRALGLADDGSQAGFTDVKSGDWYNGAMAKAYEYGIIAGYEDGAFRPAKTITRQEAITVIARAMKLAGLGTDISASGADAVLAKFSDSAAIGTWAREPVAAAVKHGIVAGSYSRILPADTLTRAEAARIVQQLLVKSKLIDNVKPSR